MKPKLGTTREDREKNYYKARRTKYDKELPLCTHKFEPGTSNPETREVNPVYGNRIGTSRTMGITSYIGEGSYRRSVPKCW